MNGTNLRPAHGHGTTPTLKPAATSWAASALTGAMRSSDGDTPSAVPASGIKLRDAMADAVVEVITVRDRRPIQVHSGSSDHLYRLVEGWACRAHLLRDGTRQITDVMVPGDFIPAHMIQHRRNGRETLACGGAKLLVLSPGPNRTATPAAFHLAREWASTSEMRILRSRLVSLGRRDARARIAHFFSELHARLDRSKRHSDNAFECPLTQEQVADVLGLTPVHVNRTLKLLRSEDVLLINRPRVVIPNLRRLHDVGGFEPDLDDQDEVRDAFAV